jgi:hypothetical protein
MADVRFLILCGPPSLDPSAAGFPPTEPREPVDVVGERTGTRRTMLRRRPDATGELATATGWWFAWRLMASNNRRLACGVTSFTARSGAVDAITRLRSVLAELQPHVLTDPQNGSWGWLAEADDVPVAACPHWYERERDCRNGFGRFTDAVGKAQVADGGIILRDHHSAPTAIAQVKESRRWPN